MSREREAGRKLIEYCRRLYEKGFMPGKDGNVSLKADEDTIVITPAGICKGMLTEDDLAYLKFSGDAISGPKPSSETPMHIVAYRQVSDAGAVIHAHSINIGAFAMAGKTIDTRRASFAYLHLGIVGDISYITPGSKQLHKAVGEALSCGYAALLLMSHGSLVVGKDIQDAYEKLDMLETYAGMLLKAQLFGGGGKILNKKELEEVIKYKG